MGIVSQSVSYKFGTTGMQIRIDSLQLTVGTPEPCRLDDTVFPFNSVTVNQSISTNIEHPGLQKLAEKDRNNNTQLYKTINLFLLNQRYQKLTADEFNIHRNSLAYRIQRIEDVIGEDLNNRDNRLYLIFSFLLRE